MATNPRNGRKKILSSTIDIFEMMEQVYSLHEWKRDACLHLFHHF
jgi:hypothetical protein